MHIMATFVMTQWSEHKAYNLQTLGLNPWKVIGGGKKSIWP